MRRLRVGRLRARTLATAAAVLAMLGAGQGIHAAFVATEASAGNSIASATVSLADNDSGSTLLSLSNAQPGASDTGCIKVTYLGSVPSQVALYGTTSGTGLAPYVELTVTRGVYSGSEPGFDSCANFQPDGSDYIGAGAGVIYHGTLDGFGDDYASGLSDPTPAAPGTWTNGDARVYRLRLVLHGHATAQGKNVTQSFVWEARNE